MTLKMAHDAEAVRGVIIGLRGAESTTMGVYGQPTVHN